MDAARPLCLWQPAFIQEQMWKTDSEHQISEQHISEDIVKLLKEMTKGKFSGDWTYIAKSAIAEAVLNLTRLGPDQRVPDEGCMWLSSVRWKGTMWRVRAVKNGVEVWEALERPTRHNHDDGDTLAIILL